MKNINGHALTAAPLSPALAALPTFPRHPEPATVDGCAFFTAADAAALALKAHYAAGAECGRLMPAQLPYSAHSFLCVYFEQVALRLSSMAWSRGVPFEGDHSAELDWPAERTPLEWWRENRPDYLARLMKCLPLPDNRAKWHGKGAK